MKAFAEACQEHTVPLVEAISKLNRGDVSAQRTAIAQLGKALSEAEAFATRNTHVQTKEADNFHAMVASARRMFAHYSGSLAFLPSPEGTQCIVIAEDENPQPPPNAITITRAEAKDPFYYRQAKAQADREHRPLWFLD